MAELDAEQCNFCSLISSKSVAVAITSATKTPLWSHCDCRHCGGNTFTAGGVNYSITNGANKVSDERRRASERNVFDPFQRWISPGD